MEFDFGNIIYILATLVAIAAGLLGKKKKPGNKGSEPLTGEEGTEVQPGIAERLERLLTGQNETVVFDPEESAEDYPFEEEVVELKTETLKTEAESGLMAEYERLMRERGVDALENVFSEGEDSTTPLEVIDLEADEGVNYFEVVKEFDPGTAVVYSAIINRLDY